MSKAPKKTTIVKTDGERLGEESTIVIQKHVPAPPPKTSAIPSSVFTDDPDSPKTMTHQKSQALIQARTKLGLTRKELAQKCRPPLSEGVIANYENPPREFVKDPKVYSNILNSLHRLSPGGHI